MMYQTNYKKAVKWLNNSLILCNDIANDPSLYDNMRFSLFDDDDNIREIFQWFLTDCSESDVEYLEQHFGLKFTFSDALELYVLCVDHFGTSWDYVYWTTDLESAQCELGE